MNILTSYSNKDRLAVSEREFVRRYGRRYRQYRRQWELAGRYKFMPKFPLYVMLEQTYRCNLRCPSCIHAYPDLRDRYKLGIPCMPWELFEKIILEGEEHRCPSIAMHCNDEPLLVKDLAKRIAFAREHGFMDIIMATNGNLFTENKIKEVIDAGITKLLFSIDAATEGTYKKLRPGGSFQKVIWAIETAAEYRQHIASALPIIRASFVYNAVNQHEIKQFISFFKKKTDYIDIQSFLSYNTVNKSLIPQYARQIDNFKCNQPWRHLIIRGNADVLPCCSSYGSDLVVGNAYKNSLSNIFNSPIMKKIKHGFKDHKYPFLTCKKCAQSLFKWEKSA